MKKITLMLSAALFTLNTGLWAMECEIDVNIDFLKIPALQDLLPLIIVDLSEDDLKALACTEKKYAGCAWMFNALNYKKFIHNDLNKEEMEALITSSIKVGFLTPEQMNKIISEIPEEKCRSVVPGNYKFIASQQMLKSLLLEHLNTLHDRNIAGFENKQNLDLARLNKKKEKMEGFVCFQRNLMFGGTGLVVALVWATVLQHTMGITVPGYQVLVLGAVFGYPIKKLVNALVNNGYAVVYLGDFVDKKGK
jgi:hypothetical protein